MEKKVEIVKAYAFVSVGFVKPVTVKVIVPGEAVVPETKLVNALAMVNSLEPEFHVCVPAALQPAEQVLLIELAEGTVTPLGTFSIKLASLGTIIVFESVN